MNKNKRKLGGSLIKVIVFLVLVVLILSSISEILRKKSGADISIPSDSCDVIFVGSSVVKVGIYPLQLYKDYGILAYNMASGNQSIPTSYFVVKQALKKSPKLVVIDVLFMGLEDYYLDQNNLHFATDKMDLAEKIECIYSLVPVENRLQVLSNICVYHNRWEELAKSDFSDEIEKRMQLGYGATISYASGEFESWGTITESCSRPPQKSEEYLRKIIELCQANNVDVMLMLSPMSFSGAYYGYQDRDKWQEYWNYVQKIADEYDVNYLNTMHCYEEIGLDINKDFLDATHRNAWGAIKFTDYVGKYIDSKYDLQNVKANKKYDYLNNDLQKYEELLTTLEQAAKTSE